MSHDNPEINDAVDEGNGDQNGDGDDVDMEDDSSPRMVAAQELYDSGDFKTLAQFNACWENAWLTTQTQARVIATSTKRKLILYSGSFVLPVAPRERREMIAWKSVFSHLDYFG